MTLPFLAFAAGQFALHGFPQECCDRLTLRRSAAARTEPPRATARKYRTSSQSIICCNDGLVRVADLPEVKG
jgi:hypothetical protein